MTGRLDGKIALVTGAGSGIGRAAAELFAAEGARVAVVDVDRDAVSDTAKAITAAGGGALAVAASITSANDLERAVATAVGPSARSTCSTTTPGVTSTGSVADADEAD